MIPPTMISRLYNSVKNSDTYIPCSHVASWSAASRDPHLTLPRGRLLPRIQSNHFQGPLPVTLHTWRKQDNWHCVVTGRFDETKADDKILEGLAGSLETACIVPISFTAFDPDDKVWWLSFYDIHTYDCELSPVDIGPQSWYQGGLTGWPEWHACYPHVLEIWTGRAVSYSALSH